jgi:SPX domain protein involved in polyphosphate accumulation
MSNLSHIVRTFNRFELKYLVPIRAAERFKQALRANLMPDDHGDSVGRYYLSSLYYDSPDFRFYWEKVDGVKFRRKLRIRYYESAQQLTADTPVFVEIKQRVNRVTQKRRVLLPYREALRLCDERQAPQGGSFAQSARDAGAIDAILGMVWQYNLRPASLVRYARQAMVGTDYDIGLRVTFDTDLSYRVSDLELNAEKRGLLLLPPDWTVIEIKVNERIPYWLTELVAVHNLSLARMSKYCRSIELAAGRDLAAPAWRVAVA